MMLIDVVKEAQRAICYSYEGGQLPDGLSAEICSLTEPDGGLLKLYRAVIDVLELHKVVPVYCEARPIYMGCQECGGVLMDYETECRTVRVIRMALGL